MDPAFTSAKPRVCAVSYLNTVPLIWGMLHGPQRDAFDLTFRTPSACADELRKGRADIGIVPVVEIARQGLAALSGSGIACRGAVRSILLVSKTPAAQIRTLAADAGSRTSVCLARVLLAEQSGAEPRIITMAPNLEAMLAEADAALLIGDAALRVDPESVPYEVWDLGGEWTRTTGLPMVFALWAGPHEKIAPDFEELFNGSRRYGQEHIEDIVICEAHARSFSEALVRTYLTENITLEIGERELEGMRAFLKAVERFDKLVSPGSIAVA